MISLLHQFVRGGSGKQGAVLVRRALGVRSARAFSTKEDEMAVEEQLEKVQAKIRALEDEANFNNTKEKTFVERVRYVWDRHVVPNVPFLGQLQQLQEQILEQQRLLEQLLKQQEQQGQQQEQQAKSLSDDLQYFVEWSKRRGTMRFIPKAPKLILNREETSELTIDAVQKLVCSYDNLMSDGTMSGDREDYPLLVAIAGSGKGKTVMGPFLHGQLCRTFEGVMPVKFLRLDFNGENNKDTKMDKEFFRVKKADPDKHTKAEFADDEARIALRLLGAITNTAQYDFLQAHKGQYKLDLTVKHVFRFAREFWGVPEKQPVMVFVHMDEIQKLDMELGTATEDNPLVEFRKVRSPLASFLFDEQISHALNEHVIPVLMVSGLTKDNVDADTWSHFLQTLSLPLPPLPEKGFAALLKWELRSKRKLKVDDAAIDKLMALRDVQQLVRDCAGHPRMINLALGKFNEAWLTGVNSAVVETWSNAALNALKNFYRIDDEARGKTFKKQFGDAELLMRKLMSGVKVGKDVWHDQWDKCGIVWRTGGILRANAPFFTLRALYSAAGGAFIPELPEGIIGARLWYWEDFERAELHIDALRTAELRARETEENRVCAVGELYAGAIWSKGSDGAEWKVGLPPKMVVKEEDKQVFAGSYDFEAMVDKNKALLYEQMRQCAAGNPGVDSWTLRKSADGRPDVICLKQSKHTVAQKRTTIDKGALQEMVAGMKGAAAKAPGYRRVLLIFTNRGVADDAVAWLQHECDEGADVSVGLICARNLAEYVPPVLLERVRHADDRSGDVWVE